MSVSTATRLRGSWPSRASRMPSLIWSAILSGWPSVTDSEVNKRVDIGRILRDGSGLWRTGRPVTVGEDLRAGLEPRSAAQRPVAPLDGLLARAPPPFVVPI